MSDAGSLFVDPTDLTLMAFIDFSRLGLARLPLPVGEFNEFTFGIHSLYLLWNAAQAILLSYCYLNILVQASLSSCNVA